MKDLYGLEYGDLLTIQQRQLVMWAERLKPELARDVTKYVYAQNRSALDPEHKHQVLRGQDIVQIIMEWPNLSPAYPPIKIETANDLI